MSLISPREVVIALMMLFPHMQHRECVVAHQEQIIQSLETIEITYPEMPVEHITSIGFVETHLGCDPSSGGNWGAPVSRLRRNVAGTPLQAARILWRSYEVCGNNWEAAMRRFRTGVCMPTTIGTRYGRMAMNVSYRLETQTLRNRH